MDEGEQGRGVEEDDDRRFGEEWAQVIAESLVSSGEIDPAGKTDEEVRLEAAHFALNNRSVLESTPFTFNHEERLLREARRYAGEAQTNLAVMLYATWFEHRLNYLLAWGARRKGMSVRESIEIIKQASVYQKTGALFQLVFDERLAQDLAQGVRQLADARNQFVHYKWPSVQMTELADAEPDSGLEGATVLAEKMVAGLDDLHVRIVLRGFGRDRFGGPSAVS